MSRFIPRSRRMVLALAATTATIVAFGWATVHSRSTVIDACAANGNGALRLSADGTCHPRETLVSWNAQGPPGPAGPAGPPGPAGTLVSYGLPIGPVRIARPGTGCTGTVVDERALTVVLEPGQYRVHPMVSEFQIVTDASGESRTSLDFNHAVTGARVAISYWRILGKGPDQVSALNSSTFELTETTPVTVRMRAEQRGCGHAEMAGILYFDRISVTAAPTAGD